MNTCDPNIRPATADDAGDIARLITALGYPCSRDRMERRLAALGADGAHAAFLAELDRRVVAMIGAFVCRIYEEDEPVGRIIALYVSAEHRRLGLGHALVERAEAWFRAQGAAAVLVNSGFQRDDAHGFYGAAGYAAKGVSFRKKISS